MLWAFVLTHLFRLYTTLTFLYYLSVSAVNAADFIIFILILCWFDGEEAVTCSISWRSNCVNLVSWVVWFIFLESIFFSLYINLSFDQSAGRLLYFASCVMKQSTCILLCLVNKSSWLIMMSILGLILKRTVLLQYKVGFYGSMGMLALMNKVASGNSLWCRDTVFSLEGDIDHLK